jgi:alkanesulfonate monooxygenase SsuD/methylene tetrahydromethanopterin reductase-like flavin-dependent oxidoreductase (luciferase family)
MKIGLQIYHFEWPKSPENLGPKLTQMAKTAERNGFASLWVMDHLFQLGGAFGSREATLLEAYSTISFLAAVTTQIKLGIMVTNNVCRYPGMLVKTVSTLDILSDGRAYLGIGAGGQVIDELRFMGIPVFSDKELIERLEETIQIAKQMWRGEVSPYKGKHYHLEKPLNNPSPLSQPHPPILIGMWSGGNNMLRLVAKYGDACNLQFGSPLKEFPMWMRERYKSRLEYLTDKLTRLEEYCDEIGRKYEDIELTVLGTIRLAPDAMTISEVVDLCQELANIGFHHVIFNMPNSHEITPIEVIGQEVIPQIQDI